MVQTTYNGGMGYAMAGLQKDSGPNDILSANADGAVPYGVCVNYNGDSKVTIPTAAAALDGGWSVRKANAESGEYADTEAVSFMVQGRMWVRTEDTPVKGDAVYARVAGVQQVQTIVLDADLIAANVISGSVGGTAVTQTYDGAAHLSTMQAFAVKIAAVAGIESAVVGGAGNRTITVTSSLDFDLVCTGMAVTLGITQAGVVTTEGTEPVLTANIGYARTDVDGATAVLFPNAIFMDVPKTVDGVKIAPIQLNYVG